MILQVRSFGVVSKGASVLPQFSVPLPLVVDPASSMINKASSQFGLSLVWVSLLVIAVLVTNTVMVAFGTEVPTAVGMPPVQVMNTSPANAVYSSARISGLFAEPAHCISVD